MEYSIKEIGNEEVRSIAKKIVLFVDVAYYQLGKILNYINAKELWKEWGYETFSEYAHLELGLKRRKAYYLMEIARKVEEIGLEVERLAEWSKVKKILKIADINREKMEQLLEKSSEMTLSEIEKVVEEELGRGETAKVIRFSCMLSEVEYEMVNLAFEKASEITNCHAKGTLLSMICADFIAGVGV